MTCEKKGIVNGADDNYHLIVVTQPRVYENTAPLINMFPALNTDCVAQKGAVHQSVQPDMLAYGGSTQEPQLECRPAVKEQRAESS